MHAAKTGFHKVFWSFLEIHRDSWGFIGILRDCFRDFRGFLGGVGWGGGGPKLRKSISFDICWRWAEAWGAGDTVMRDGRTAVAPTF